MRQAKKKEEIVRDSIKLETPPEEYNLLEIYCFLALKQLTTMYLKKQITKEKASKIKQLILTNYEKRYKEYEFQEEIYKKHIQNIKDTEKARIKLHKILNEKEEITEKKLCETLNTCIEIITKVFKGEF